MKNKLIALLCAAAMSVGMLAGCGNAANDQTNETWQKVFDSDLIVALKRIEIIEKESKAIILPESA